MDAASLLQQRRAKDEFFASPHSPLDDGLLPGFAGLEYYDPNPELVFTVPVGQGDGAEIPVQTSDGQVRAYMRAGHVNLLLAGQEIELTLYTTSDPGFFVPFRDQTSGRATYGAGRYLDIEPNDDGTVTIDFNLAYNPYCAYNDSYSCPLPPAANWLQVPVEAGERSFRR